MSDYPTNAAPNPPPPVSSDLRVYTDAAGNVWGRDYATGVGYLLSSPQGAVGAPPAGGGNAVQKTGDSMSGPLAIATATQPELHVADAAGGVQTLDVNNSSLKLADSSVGNSVTLNLANVLLAGAGASTTGVANRTSIGVNSLGLAHKSYNQGNQPLSVYQGNNGELSVQFFGGQIIRLTDFANSRLYAPSISMVSPDQQSVVSFAIVNGGDIVVTQTAGPNAGKSVNLTFGKWV